VATTYASKKDQWFKFTNVYMCSSYDPQKCFLENRLGFTKSPVWNEQATYVCTYVQNLWRLKIGTMTFALVCF
jgi:hypothetical protein